MSSIGKSSIKFDTIEQCLNNCGLESALGKNSLFFKSGLGEQSIRRDGSIKTESFDLGHLKNCNSIIYQDDNRTVV